MAKSNPTELVTFSDLHLQLKQDPYYGVDAERNSPACAQLLKETYCANSDDARLQSFRYHYRLKPCKSDRQRELIYVWCGFGGLPGYRGGYPLGWKPTDFATNWTEDFDIDLNELRTFLRNEGLPLPYRLFPNEADNSRTFAEDEQAFARARHALKRLVEREQELAEVRHIVPASKAARDWKKKETARLEAEIESIKDLITLRANEKHENRTARLQCWDAEAGGHGAPSVEVGSPAWREQRAREAADARHGQAGGSRDKQERIREIWATGKYTTRDRCAEEECAALNMSFSAARKALRGTPKP